MHSDLLQHSPLLALPLGAMFVFLGVWVVAAVRVLTKSAEEMAAAARLPLEVEVGHERH
ncbi:MAG: hypothetical protein ABSC94_13520 [Polyangiaceae bacterium]|jgi:hypothetical protein